MKRYEPDSNYDENSGREFIGSMAYDLLGTYVLHAEALEAVKAGKVSLIERIADGMCNNGRKGRNLPDYLDELKKEIEQGGGSNE